MLTSLLALTLAGSPVVSSVASPEGPIFTNPATMSSVILRLPLTASTADECSGASIPGVTFSRSSSATCTKTNGTVVTLSANQPRVTAAGLLVEGGGTNLFTLSAAMDTWGANSASGCTYSNVTSPDGTSDAVRITSTGASPCSRFLSVSITSGTSYVWSGWVRAGSLTDLKVRAANWNTTGCTVTGAASWGTRFACTGTATATGSTNFIYEFTSSTAGTLDVWGFQLETGSIATSYNPTGGTSTARTNEVGPIATPAALGDTQGCMAATVKVPTTLVADARIIGTTGSNGLAFSGTGYEFLDGTNTTSTTASVGGQTRRVKVTWSGSTATISDDAGNSGSGTYDGAWLTSTLYLGSQNGSSNFLNSNISNVVFGRTPGACQ